MYATQKNQIRGLSKKQYEALRMLCRLSKNLYNVGLYSIRQYFFQESIFGMNQIITTAKKTKTISY